RAHAANHLHHLARRRRQVAAIDATRCTVERDPIALGDGRIVHAKATMYAVDVNVLTADDRALAHPARDDCSVTRHSAARREHRARRDDAVEILRRRLIAHENHVLTRVRTLLGHIGVEDGDATGRAWTRRQSGTERRRAHTWIYYRVEQLIE